jgi:hypothetical protein
MIGIATIIQLKVVRWRWQLLRVTLAAGVMCTLSFLAMQQVLPSLYARSPAATKPDAILLTSLPIVWGGGSMTDVIDGRAAPDPAFKALEARLNVTVRDAVPENMPAKTVLFLAHPYALSPRDLVTIDAHVRRGGRALILADAMSTWEPPFAIGDPRNPPVTSLLTPLLDHWGVNLVVREGLGGGTERVRDGDVMLELTSAGDFKAHPPKCDPFAKGAGLRCRIGAGHVTLLSDADMLAATHWQGRGGYVPGQSRSDNIDWLAAEARRLAELPPEPSPWFKPLWF